ncbi:MAG TPA: hypothetical protein VJN50_01840 [Actinomycetota bacterium]|nr:hypothetical protein [Actinomycetota bacterium]
MTPAILTVGSVADRHPPERRAKAIGVVLAAGTIGAVGGFFARRVGDRFVPELVGFPILALGMAAVVVPTMVLGVPLREPAPGRWSVTETVPGDPATLG